MRFNKPYCRNTHFFQKISKLHCLLFILLFFSFFDFVLLTPRKKVYKLFVIKYLRTLLYCISLNFAIFFLLFISPFSFSANLKVKLLFNISKFKLISPLATQNKIKNICGSLYLKHIAINQIL